MPHPVFDGLIDVWPKQDELTRTVIPSCNQLDILKICISLPLSCLLLCLLTVLVSKIYFKKKILQKDTHNLIPMFF